jgi:hypothetical protein
MWICADLIIMIYILKILYFPSSQTSLWLDSGI